ncbi:PaaI family thioesterase [Novosphingobium sp. KA1]|uniref:PaaI family thioesterase n=1 Tax=Novosphingobium sp. (strain KA1) TaxID=164608 RepID=UPI001A8C4E1A|nr:PaaI family thioesterase [Novosphingobium sp. KA1]QSR20377.1 phenylacetic acid degradation protein [Novosphingobium sp. KA1]
MNLREMTGLELMRAVVSGKLSPSAMASTVPMTFTDADLGRVAITARADDRHLNPMGGVHGGFAATVLDSVTGCAVHSSLEPDASYGTIDLQVKMLRPVPRNEDLLAEGTTVHISRNLATAQGTLKSADRKLLATATAICFLKRP